MLSEEAEKFLRAFRIEMMAHGKTDDAIDEMEAELEDHLIQAEQDGKSVDSVTGGSVKEYIKIISEEMPTVNHLKKKITLFIIYLAGILTIPTLIGGTFEWTLSSLLYYAVIIVLGPITLYAVFKKIIVDYASFKTEKIAGKGYMVITIFSILYMVVLVGGLLLARKYPIVTLFELNSSMNIIIGFILLAVLVIGSLIMKQWFFAILATALAAPEIIAQLFADGGPKSESYLIVSSVAFFIVLILIFTGLIISNKRDAQKNN